MIVGTSGHIDHGKTALVRALTGIDPDRLPEEKRRGITIDLGFAHLRTESGEAISFVDVPGHERLIHNMVAGSTGLDYALLVVAADDGPMSQTHEHLVILDLLGISRGVVAISKIDLVPPGRVAAVIEEVRELLAASRLAGADLFPVSARSGAGIDELKARLVRDSQIVLPRPHTRFFRMPIDRSFTVHGVGRIVTGTVMAGSVAPGDALTISPAGIEARVRGLHVHGRSVSSASTGERCAVNLAGPRLQKQAIERGQWLLHPALNVPTDRIDVRLHVASSERKPLEHWTMATLHIGAARLDAFAAMLDRPALLPGETGLVQLVASRPIAALHGDRFILRDHAARRTIAGGWVLDPWPPHRGRRRPERLARLRAGEADDEAEALAGLLEMSPDGVDLAAFTRARNSSAGPDRLTAEGRLVTVSQGGVQRGFGPAAWTEVRRQVTARLIELHDRFPQMRGFAPEVVRSLALPDSGGEVFRAIVSALASENTIELDGNLIRMPGMRPRFTSADEESWALIASAIACRPFDPPSLREHAAQLGISEARANTLLRGFANAGRLMQLGGRTFFLTTDLPKLAKVLERLASQSRDAEVATSAFRDAIGASRRKAIEILEFFDSIGATARRGNGRSLHRDRLARWVAADLPEDQGKRSAPGGAAGLQIQ